MEDKAFFGESVRRVPAEGQALRGGLNQVLLQLIAVLLNSDEIMHLPTAAANCR